MRFPALATALFALSSCAATLQPGGTDPTEGRNFCAVSTSPVCRFLDAPVRLSNEEVRLPGRPYRFYPISRRLNFVDGSGRPWVAPVGTLTDGASIPVMFASIVGSPTSPEFVNAAALHDAMCGIGNTELPGFHSATWESTHRMFYDALRVGGTDEKRAKIMFAAVYLGGPRWIPGDKTFDIRQLAASDPRISTQGTGAVRTRGLSGQALGTVDEAGMKRILRATIAYIERDNPPIGAIEAYITTQEGVSIAEAMVNEHQGGVDIGEEPAPVEEPEPETEYPYDGEFYNRAD
ncbi:DUF1353 domain-containing protein [Oceanicola sp. 22II-s10i]|uniref:DUF1353 domain-containing protein n=1 Tax=Oceanicola sp. 22II-s10i TaxID=1317116 RepID=UPI000B525E42|nr:DUF1353 domain-containing protein [Oceanicola sp. 22II-s10i]